MTGAPVVVVGAGLAGLACARSLAAAQVPVVVLEASDGLGGRVRTDRHEGFLLDRGFQVLLTGYPECRRQLDYAALDLRPFYPGAIVRVEGRFHRVADPFRRPLDALRSLGSPVGSFADKLRVLGLRRRALAGTQSQLWQRPATSTLATLTGLGFSSAMIDRFFRPFLGGIFLGRDLATSSRLLDFVMRMLAVGDTAVPAAGMGAIAEQLASTLPDGTLRLRSEVVALANDGVVLASGERIDASAVVVATEGDVAARLLGLATPASPRSVSAVYFDAPASPVGEATVVLNGDAGLVNNLAVMSDVAPTYAPPGRALVVAAVLGANQNQVDAQAGGDVLAAQVQTELTRWYGEGVRAWRHLRTYAIRWAQPSQLADELEPVERPVRVGPGRFVAGDHVETATLHGALVSGRRAAEAVLAERSR